jgi:hypothetical protein
MRRKVNASAGGAPIWPLVAMFYVVICWPASAVDLKDMVGKWRWREFTLEVKLCQDDGVCAKIIAGPENVGMDVFTSKLVAKGGDWFGQIADPETKEKYNTRFHQIDNDRWLLDGCTGARVCLSGEFVRAK